MAWNPDVYPKQQTPAKGGQCWWFFESNASMGFINTPQLYRVVMDCIYKLAEMSNINPIVYDYWCWEEKHENHYFE